MTTLLFSSTPTFAQERPYDYLIKNALIFDGQSFLRGTLDLAVTGNRIVGIGEIHRSEAQEVIEAAGLVLSPGFIDIHTHSDFSPFVYPALGNKVRQGVTTEVIGNCGMSAAPAARLHRSHIGSVWSREGVEVPSSLPWRTFDDYASEAELRGLETHFAGLVGHGNLRSEELQMAPGDPTPEQLEGMKEDLRKALDEGAFGVSFGLIYLPGIFAKHKELVELCRVAGEGGRLCVFHIRSEGNQLEEAIEEALAIGKEAGARVHISHLKAAGQAHWPKIENVFRMIEKAQAEGMKVTADAYPYTAGFAELGVILPREIYERSDRLAYFKDPAQREALLHQLHEYDSAHPVSWGSIRVATVRLEKNFGLRGRALSEIAQAQKKSPEEALVDLLAEEEFRASAFYFSQSEEVIEKVLSKPYVAIGSDSIAEGSAVPHPRAWGTFPKVLARCRESGPPPKNPCWERTLRQMTSFAAEILGLRGRGRITIGAYADLVLFDPSTVRDQATYENPTVSPQGVRWVFVNGDAVVRDGKYQPLHAGVFLTSEG